MKTRTRPAAIFFVGLIGVAADSGQLLWRYDRIANGTANIPHGHRQRR